MTKHPKRPRDPNQLAKLTVDLSVGEAQVPAAPEDTAIVTFAMFGGLIGGVARAASLSAYGFQFGV